MLNGSFTVYGLRLVNTFSSVTNNPLTFTWQSEIGNWGLGEIISKTFYLEFKVLQLFPHEFDVQVKRSTNKWSCRVCNEKQSLKQVYFKGSGRECRIRCQELNMNRMNDDIQERQNTEGKACPLAYYRLKSFRLMTSPDSRFLFNAYLKFILTF